MAVGGTVGVKAGALQALIDAGPMVALFDVNDEHHHHYTDVLAAPGTKWFLYTTWPCVVEASHLLEPAASRAMLLWVARGAVQVYPFEPAQLVPMVTVMQGYSERGRTRMDLADASLYWVATHTRIRTVFTVDHRDFSRYRLPNGQAFEIV